MLQAADDLFKCTWQTQEVENGIYYVSILLADALGNDVTHFNVTWAHLLDYLRIKASMADIELLTETGLVVNATYNDFYDEYGHPLAYQIQGPDYAEIVLLSPSAGIHHLRVTYRDDPCYDLLLDATCDGLLIGSRAFLEITLSPGDLHEYLLRYESDVARPEFTATAIPDILIVVSTDTLFTPPGSYLQCHVDWLNIDPGTARDAELRLRFSNYLEFVNCSQPVSLADDMLVVSLGTVSGFSSGSIGITFFLVNLLAANGTDLWMNATMHFADEWNHMDNHARDDHVVTVVTALPEQVVQTSLWWKNEFSAVLSGRKATYSAARLLMLVKAVAYSSEVFSEVTNMQHALSILIMHDVKGLEGMALRELYTVWLNLANSALTRETQIDLGDLTTAGTVGQAILECEGVLNDISAGKQEILRVMRICLEINCGRY
jgi:hypothetical protein